MSTQLQYKKEKKTIRKDFTHSKKGGWNRFQHLDLNWEGQSERNKVVEAQRQEHQVCMWKVSGSYPQTDWKRLLGKECELHSPTPQKPPLSSLSAVCLTHSCLGGIWWPAVEDTAPAVNVTLWMQSEVSLAAGVFFSQIQKRHITSLITTFHQLFHSLTHSLFDALWRLIAPRGASFKIPNTLHCDHLSSSNLQVHPW